jgi:hypothetical protein
MLCAAEISDTPLGTARFCACLTQTRTTMPLGWEDCASQAGIDVGGIKTCAMTEAGDELLASSYDAMMAADVPVSPWVVIDGMPFYLELEPQLVQEALCCAMGEDARPGSCPAKPGCFNVPVDLTVILDPRCPDCTSMAEEAVGNLVLPFPMLTITIVQFGDPGAAELFEASGAGVLPVLLLGDNATASAGWGAVEELTYEAGGYHVVIPDLMGARFDPTAEICDNGVDDTSDGKADCEDPACALALNCRPELPAKLDLFIMSECPFGTEALFALYDVSHHFDETIDIRVHWITTIQDAAAIVEESLDAMCVARDGQALCGLHGHTEVEENLRQICIQSLYTTKEFMAYARCRTGPANLPWEECAEAAELDVGTIEGCSLGAQGFDLLADDGVLADALGVDASPTYIFNNKYVEGVDPKPGDIADAICIFNPDLAGCDETGGLEHASGPEEPHGKCGQ